MKTQIILKSALHRNKKIVTIQFAYDAELLSVLRKNFPAHWSQTKKCWWIDRTEFDYEKFKKVFSNLFEIIISEKKRIIEKQKKLALPNGYLEKLQRLRYSDSTIKTYSKYFKNFQSAFTNRDMTTISINEINAYLHHQLQNEIISISQQNQLINAIKFYYEKVLGRNKEYYKIERPRKQKQLPKVLSKGEVISIIKQCRNSKHRRTLSLLYLAGLRRNELINMKFTDIISERNQVRIYQAKGNKDCYSILSLHLLIELREYYKEYKPKEWLFEGRKPATQYSAISIRNILNYTCKKVGIKIRITPHMLRQSFATHLLEQGTDLPYIQTIPGHESSKTIEIYTHVSKKSLAKIKSPLDVILTNNNKDNNNLHKTTDERYKTLCVLSTC